MATLMPAEARQQRKSTVDWTGPAIKAGLPVLALIIALLVGAVIMLILGTNPLTAYAALVSGVAGPGGLAQSLVKATPLLLVGLGICIAFRASVLNIGAEGQIILGAVGAAWFALSFPSLPGWLLLTLTILVGFIAGAAWGFIPGILKARLHVNEILSTVMLNAIAFQLMNFLLHGPMMDPKVVEAGTFLAQSARLPDQASLPRLIPQTLLNAGTILAVILAVVVYLFLWHTPTGYRIRAVGLNPDASRYAGISVPIYQALSLTLAGGFAGLAGAVEILGVHHRLLEGITSGYGFSGIVAALFGGLHPLGLLPASWLFGGLLVGADRMQRATQVPASLIDVQLGLIVLLVSGATWLAARWSQRRMLAGAKERG